MTEKLQQKNFSKTPFLEMFCLFFSFQNIKPYAISFFIIGKGLLTKNLNALFTTIFNM